MRRARVSTAAFLFGVGFGGLLDGIVLHHIVHWHQMLSSAVPPDTMDAMVVNMRADGWFDLAVWIAAALGVVFLFSAFRAPGRMPSGRSFIGYILVGWGAFNLVEGMVNHLILNLHHVHDLPTHLPLYDWGFLAGSVLVLLIGLALRDARDPGPVSDRRSGADRRLGSMLPH
jgi:uncharacterized membrane protein